MKEAKPSPLIKKYPKIFRQYKLPMTETCMCWGLECGDGWYGLIDTLCKLLQWDIDKNSFPQIEATQVKEKFGTLRFYYNYADEACTDDPERARKQGVQDGMVRFAEYLSGSTCEKCGTNQDVKQTTGWIVTLCPTCMEKYDKSQT